MAHEQTLNQRPLYGIVLVRSGITSASIRASCPAGSNSAWPSRALAMEPRVMLFDELTSAPDPEMIDVVRELAAEKMTMMIVTHEMDFAREVADRVAYMDEGRIVETGIPRQHFDAPIEERTRLFLSRVLRN